MRARLAWGGMILLIALAAKAEAQPGPDGIRVTVVAQTPVAKIALPGMDVAGGRLALGFYDAGTKRSFNVSVREALSPPKAKRAPGVGFRLAF